MEKREGLMSASSGKSQFVTRLAWTGIVITGFATFMSLLQNIIVSVLLPIDQMKEVFVVEPRMSKYVPALVSFMMTNIRLIFFGYLVLSTAMFISSIGLLKRKNWARIIFIFIISVGIASSLAGVFFQGAMMGTVIPILPEEYVDMPGMPNFQAMFLIIRIASGVLVIFMVALYGWIIKKLVSKEIKQEFIQDGPGR